MKHLMLLLFSLSACSFAQATVHVWCDSPLEEISPWLYGSGDEMDEDLVPLEELTSMVGQTGVSMLRMGGIANEYYDWEGNNYNGTRYLDLLDTLIIVQNAETSMDDFLQMCEVNQIEPILSVNFQLNDPAKAARLVEYCNGPEGSPMGQIRAQRGHPEPYGVTYWQIGNEPDISGLMIPHPQYTWTLYRHFGIPFDQWHWSDSVFATSTQYAQLADNYADAMRAASPIPLEIATISLASSTDWLQETIETCSDNTDWVDIHYYPSGSWEQTPSDTTDYITYLMSLDSGPKAFEPWYQEMKTFVESCSGGAGLPVCVMEYNVLLVNSDPAWWNYIDGLFIADCLGHMSRVGCPMAGSYSIFEGSPDEPFIPNFGMIRGDTLSCRSTVWVMRMLSENLTGTAVNATSSAIGGGYGLEVHSSLRDDGLLCIVCVNKHLTDEYQTTINLHGFVSSGYAQVMSIENDAPMEAPFNGTTGIQYPGGIWGTGTTFTYTFPRASVTCLLVHPEGSGIEPESPVFNMNVSPVPSQGTTFIQLYTDINSEVEVKLFDTAGRELSTVFNELCTAGETQFQFNTGDLPGGFYLLQGISRGERIVERMVVIPGSAP